MSQEDLKETMRDLRGQVLTVKGKPYPVLAMLGHGGEGKVYLVTSSQGLRAAKVFFGPDQMSFNISFGKGGTRGQMPKVIKTDSATSTALMEYIEGIPVVDILFGWKRFGIPRDTAFQIENDFYREFGRGKNGANVVYSFKQKRFHLIDPF